MRCRDRCASCPDRRSGTRGPPRSSPTRPRSLSRMDRAAASTGCTTARAREPSVRAPGIRTAAPAARSGGSRASRARCFPEGSRGFHDRVRRTCTARRDRRPRKTAKNSSRHRRTLPRADRDAPARSACVLQRKGFSCTRQLSTGRIDFNQCAARCKLPRHRRAGEAPGSARPRDGAGSRPAPFRSHCRSPVDYERRRPTQPISCKGLRRWRYLRYWFDKSRRGGSTRRPPTERWKGKSCEQFSAWRWR